MTSDDMVGMLRAAGEPSRLRILALLHRGELAVAELATVLQQSQPRVSRHLRLLGEAGLVERFPDGAWVFYRLASSEAGRAFVERLVGELDPADPLLAADLMRLHAVEQRRGADADAYFARNAVQWDALRSLHVEEAAVEAAILRIAGPGPWRRLIDLGAGTGRMLTLLGGRARAALGLDLSSQMLNIARARVAQAGLASCELRHGDILATGLPDGAGDRVVMHSVLHYLNDPAAAVAEAGRLTAPGGELLVVDYAPHEREELRAQHQHRRLGFSDDEMARWLHQAGLGDVEVEALPPGAPSGLTVKIWRARRAEAAGRDALDRSAA